MTVKRFALGGFKNVTDDELLVRACTVALAMEENPYFAGPRPGIDLLRLYQQDFATKLAATRRKGSRQDTAAKNQSRLVLGAALKELAFYVNTRAGGDLLILLSSGFALNSLAQKGYVPDVVRAVRLSDGRQSGQMRLDFTRQAAVLLYEYRYGLKAGTAIDWQANLRSTVSRNNVIAPLEPYCRYYVQVRAVNGYGAGIWSEPVSMVSR